MNMAMLEDLGDVPAHFADCCVALSRPLIQAIADRLPKAPATTLSIGSGSGLLESLLLQYRDAVGEETFLDLHGVEVPTCVNKYLPEDRLLRVPSTNSVYHDAMFASALIFVYPRQVSLLAQYLDACLNGVLEKILWLGHRSDWVDTEKLISTAFGSIEYFEDSGIAEYEVLVIATEPRISSEKLATGS